MTRPPVIQIGTPHSPTREQLAALLTAATEILGQPVTVRWTKPKADA